MRSTKQRNSIEKKMPSHIPDGFRPSNDSYDNLKKHGCIPEFVDYELDLFITYWSELKEKKQKKGRKSSWQLTLQTWMRRAWRGKAGREWEYNRHKREGYANQGNPFESVLSNLQPKEPEKPQKRNYRLPDPPPKGEAMSREEALAALSKLRLTKNLAEPKVSE